MKDKGKSVKSEQQNPNFFSNSNYFQSSSDIPCKRHPSNSSTVGICAYCLNEKLIELVCLDCGEQRLSSCSCSELSSYRNSSCTLDIGSVGRISFLIENEKVNNNNGDEPKTMFTELKLKQSEAGDVVMLKRCNSCVVDVKKSNGFWKIRKIFNRKREKEGFGERNSGIIACSSAKISDFNESESRKSGYKDGLMDFRRGIPEKECDFSGIDDDDEFIDLKIDLSNKSKTEQSVLKKYDPPGGDVGSLSGRIMVNERGIKKVKSSHMMAWKWIFKNHSGKNDFNHIFES